MPLTVAEIDLGCVAFFDPRIWNADRRVCRPKCPTPDPHPFVCYAVWRGESYWAPITTKNENGYRLLIEPGWKLGDGWEWQSKPQFLNDGGTTFRGPHASFVAAVVKVLPAPLQLWPKVTEEGVTAIRREVRDRGGQFV